MEDFVPKPITEYQSDRDSEIERLKILNPQAPLEELTDYVDDQFEFVASPDWQFHQRFDKRHMTEYITVVRV